MDRIRSYECFVRVVDSGSFTRAAGLLDLPKASVSQHVARLEQHLGVRLLQRSTRRLHLTPDGSACYERARALLDDLADLESGLRAEGRAPRGRLRVDVPAAFGRHALVPALPAFFARHPEIRLELGSSDRPVDLLQEGVDCVIRGGDVHDDSLVGRRLRTLAVATAAAPTYLRGRRRPRHPRDLAEHALIGYFSAKTGRTYAFDFERDGERIEVDGPFRLAVNDADSYLEATLAGLGVAQIVVSAEVARQFDARRLVRLLPEWTAEPLEQHILYPSRRHLAPRLRAFVDWVVERFGEPGV
jgi:LysR family transcriptional regulator for bpeEF and oprC